MVNITLPENLLKRIDRAAKQEERSRSEWLREAARRHLEEGALRGLATEQRESLTGYLKTQSVTGEAGIALAEERAEWASLGASSLARIWDNDKDAAYDSWKPDGNQT